MLAEKKFLVDVGMRDLPFPIRVNSKVNSDGQFTIANISINARIMQEFEAIWIDKFIQILHQHRDCIGTKTLGVNIIDYLKELNVTSVTVDFDYPFFIEKLTPISKEKCLVRYPCTYSAKVPNIEKKPQISLRMNIPVITTYPGSTSGKPGGLFGQLSIVVIETKSTKDIYPEDIVEIVDKHALAPVYSFLTEEDQTYLIQKIHSEIVTSVGMTDKIKNELARNYDIDLFSIRCANYGMLHSYSTVIGTEKSLWVPFTTYGEEI
jgi:GTP cyclohydrolase I